MHSESMRPAIVTLEAVVSGDDGTQGKDIRSPRTLALSTDSTGVDRCWASRCVPHKHGRGTP